MSNLDSLKSKLLMGSQEPAFELRTFAYHAIAALEARVAELERERDEARRRRDEWRKKADMTPA